MDQFQDDAEFEAIVRRIGDPDDRRDRRRVIAGAIIGILGLALSIFALLADWSPWVAAVGIPAMAAADLVGLVTLRAWLHRRRQLHGPRRHRR